MDYRDVGAMVMEEVFKSENRRFVTKYCPTCGKDTEMMKSAVEDIKSKGEFVEDIEKLRCLNCLGLFEETVQPATKED